MWTERTALEKNRTIQGKNKEHFLSSFMTKLSRTFGSVIAENNKLQDQAGRGIFASLLS